MSRAQFRVANPGAIEFELTMKLPLLQWIQIKDELGTRVIGPVADLSFAIRDMVTQAEKVYYPDEE